MHQRATPDGSVVGLDTEWASTEGSSPSVAILQLADAVECLVIRVPYCLPLPASLSNLLADPKVIKSGVAIENDAAMLKEEYGLLTRSWVDCRGPAEEKNVSHGGKNGLQGLSRAVLNRDLRKDEWLRCGDWSSEELSAEQVNRSIASSIDPGYHSIFLAFSSLLAKRVCGIDRGYMFSIIDRVRGSRRHCGSRNSPGDLPLSEFHGRNLERSVHGHFPRSSYRDYTERRRRESKQASHRERGWRGRERGDEEGHKACVQETQVRRYLVWLTS